MNPMDMIKLMSGKMTPKDMAMKLLENNPNPMFKNLIDMAEKGENEKIFNFAKNLYSQSGKNFEEEYNKFKDMFK